MLISFGVSSADIVIVVLYLLCNQFLFFCIKKKNQNKTPQQNPVWCNIYDIHLDVIDDINLNTSSENSIKCLVRKRIENGTAGNLL